MWVYTACMQPACPTRVSPPQLRRSVLSCMCAVSRGPDLSVKLKQHLRELSAAAAAGPKDGYAAARAFHELGDALEHLSPVHSRAAWRRSILATHSTITRVPSRAMGAVTSPAAHAARLRGIRLTTPSDRAEAVAHLARLHEQQFPASCATAPLLLLPLWPCCEGLASRAHTVAAALAQAAWTDATVVPFTGGCTSRASCELSGGIDQSGLLLNLSSCSLGASLDDEEFRALLRTMTSLDDARQDGRVAVLLPPGSARRRLHGRLGAGEEAARCSLSLLVSEHFANAAALVPTLPPVSNRSHLCEHGRGLLWASSLLNYVVTLRPEAEARLRPLLRRLRRQRRLGTISGLDKGGAAAEVASARAAPLIALHVRHGDKADEPWRAPRLPLRAYLRAAAALAEEMHATGGLLFVASDNASLLAGLDGLFPPHPRDGENSGHGGTTASAAGSRLDATGSDSGRAGSSGRIGRAVRSRLPRALRHFDLATWPTWQAGETLAKLRPDLRAHRSAPSVKILLVASDCF